MKTHTSNFKNQIKTLGRQQNIQIIYTINGITTTLQNEDINSITPNYRGNLLKSVMKELEIDSNVIIPEQTEIQFKYGLLVNGTYEYLDYGKYIVYKVEKQEDKDSYLLTCYDKLLYSMVDYEDMDITYPITVRNYINTICNHLGITFANISDTFANYDKQIPTELYLNIGYTFRDVLDDLAEVTASTICINDDDELEIRYINDTNDTIDEEFLKDINVNFGEKYGKINSIVLSRGGESDNVYLRDEESIAQYGLCEVKIIDNQIMNDNNRSIFLPDILEELDGIEYYLNDYTSTGIMYYDLLDRYNVQIGENTYSCLMLNDEQDITQGLEEQIYTELPEISETDYTKADKTDQRINKTTLIVDKVNQEISSVVQQIGDRSQSTTTITQDINSINSRIENIADFTNEINAFDRLHLTETVEGEGYVLDFIIKGNSNIFYALTPEEDLVPSDELVPQGGDITLVIDKQNTISQDAQYFNIEIGEPLRHNGDVYDEVNIGRDGTVKIIRRINSYGNVMPEPIETVLEDKFLIPTFDNDTYLYIRDFRNVSYYCKYIIKSDFSDTFTTHLEMNSAITQKADEITSLVSANYETKEDAISQYSEFRQTTDEITLEVSRKVGNNEVISKINQSSESISINANRISLNRKSNKHDK